MTAWGKELSHSNRRTMSFTHWERSLFYDSVAFVWKISVCWMLFGLVQVKITCFHILLSMDLVCKVVHCQHCAIVLLYHAFINREVHFMLQLLVFSAPDCWLAFFPSLFSSSFSSSARIKWFFNRFGYYICKNLSANYSWLGFMAFLFLLDYLILP